MPYLEVRALAKSYPTPAGTTHVLGGVNLALDEREFVAIVGYSGSGKTTLVSLIAGLIAPDAARSCSTARGWWDRDRSAASCSSSTRSCRG
jgi:ABC-type lipoprotein export system ATPase subunit